MRGVSRDFGSSPFSCLGRREALPDAPERQKKPRNKRRTFEHVGSLSTRMSLTVNPGSSADR